MERNLHSRRYTYVDNLLAIDKPTILVLQETELADAKMTNLTFHSKDLVIYSGIKQLNGVAVFSTLPFIGTILTQITDCMVLIPTRTN
jgi:exonuclease III